MIRRFRSSPRRSTGSASGISTISGLRSSKRLGGTHNRRRNAERVLFNGHCSFHPEMANAAEMRAMECMPPHRRAPARALAVRVSGLWWRGAADRRCWWVIRASGLPDQQCCFDCESRSQSEHDTEVAGFRRPVAVRISENLLKNEEHRWGGHIPEMFQDISAVKNL